MAKPFDGTTAALGAVHVITNMPTDASDERWERLQALFHDALDRTGPDRERFIDEVTAGDARLSEELRALIRHTDGAQSRIARAIQGVARQAAGLSHWTGRHFGPYRLGREIGRGGMGLVFEAWRDDAEYDKRVALKIAPDWRDLNALRERFRKERQILARIEHPNVARFLDGGTQDGIPWFAMEYVDGKPVTVWATERNASLRERLVLFRQVCAAVTYAHENLIIHRDLKPANILVDSKNAPKLLDFGIATLLDSVANSGTHTTGLRLWTPDYASPEQLRGGSITVRTDVYSLGLILYELVCGERAQVADASSPAALERSICETDAQPPSTRAAARGDRNLSRRLRGDLDKVVLKAVRKEPERRYSSVGALSADIERFLAGRPVEARPNTVFYRATKLMKRHWAGTAAAVVLAASVLAGVGSTMYQARRAERRFEQVRSLANAFIFDVHDRIQYLPGSTEARKAIVATALKYLENLYHDAANDPALVRELAAAYMKIGDVQGNPTGSSLGDTSGALVSYRRAEQVLVPLADRGDGAARLALIDALYRRGRLEHALGNSTGEQDLERARAMARPLLAEQPRNVEALTIAADINSDVTRIFADARKAQPAMEAARETLKIAQRMLVIDPNREQSRDYLAVAQSGLAMAYLVSGDVEQSVRTCREMVRVRDQLATEHPDNVSYQRLLLVAYGHLGDMLAPAAKGGLGQNTEAVASFEKAAAIADRISERDPSDKTSLFDVTAAHMRTGSSLLEPPVDAVKAVAELSRAEVNLSKLMQGDPANQRYRLYALVLDCDMGRALSMLRKNRDAERRLEQGRVEARSLDGGPNERNARFYALVATLHLSESKAQLGDRISALALANEAARGASNDSLFRAPWRHAAFFSQLGSLYAEIGKPDVANTWFRKSADLLRAIKVPSVLEDQRQRDLAEVERKIKDR